MKTVLVTGGIGSGKSEVCRYLLMKGYPVYDCDSRVKALYDEVPGLWNYICAKFEIRTRAELAQRLFSDAGAREQLEAVVYPVLKDDFLEWRDSRNAGLVFMESAVAAQKPSFDGVADFVLFVDAPLQDRLARACRRDNADEEKIRARMDAQSPDPSGADFIIMNDSDLHSLREKVDEAVKILKTENNEN